MTKGYRDAVSSSANSDSKCIDGRLSTLFNTLQNKTAKTHAITEHLKIVRVSQQDDAAECFEKILSCSSPQASQIFQGQLIHRNICSKCHTDTCDEQPFWSLPLPLMDSDKDYCVINGIKSFFEESNISGENQMYCNRCNAKADATIKAEMKQHPQVLTLLMKRFKFDHSGMKYVKINHSVEIPFNLLIPPSGGQSQEYELYASVQHSGDLRHGHYTVSIKPEDEEKWYNFSDTTVTSLSPVDYKKRSQNAYLLFYKKNTSSQVNSEISLSEGPKNGNKDQTQQREQDVKTGKRKVEAADIQKTDGRSGNNKRKAVYRGGQDSKAVPDDNCGTSMSQKTAENLQSKNHDPESQKDICDNKICQPVVCSFEGQNGEECKRGENGCSESKIDHDNGKLAHVRQDFSKVSTSEAPKHNTQDKKEQQKQDVKAKERREDEEAGAADNQKTDKSKSKTEGKPAFRRDKDSKTLSEHSWTSVNHKSGKQSSKNQHQWNDDGRLKEGNGQNPNPDDSRRRQTSSQITQYNHQVTNRRNGRKAAENQQSKQNHDKIKSKKEIGDKVMCNPSACSSEEQDREEDCKRGDDQELTKDQSERHCKESEVDQDDGKLTDVSQEMSEVCNLNISQQHVEESNEKTVVNMTENQDRGADVKIQGDDEKMTDQYRSQSERRGSHRMCKEISLCSDQTQKKQEDSVSVNTSMNNQEHKLVTSNSVLIRHEHCGGSDGNQDNGKSDEVCPNKLREDRGQEVNTQGITGTNEDVEAMWAPRMDKTDTLSCDFKNLSLSDSSESKKNSDEHMNGEVENNTEIKSLTESSTEGIENVSLGTQTVVSVKPHESDRKGRKNKKGQNKQNKTLFYHGLPSPKTKNTNQSP